MSDLTPSADKITEEALEAQRRGWVPVPIREGAKRPAGTQWSSATYATEDEVRDLFGPGTLHVGTQEVKIGGLGLLLGEPSGGLVDVDLDHPKALRLRDLFLPPTAMMTGRPATRRSHLWYTITEDLPEGTRRYQMPDGSAAVELRSTGGQTVIPPSIHPSGEPYLWEGEAWGGAEGPAHVHGRILSARVATLAMACVLLEAWPKQGSRHDAYLALAGGLLRYGDGIHPLWETALPNLIRALADASQDEDGADLRVEETMNTTLDRLRTGGRASGWPTLSRLIGEEHVEFARRYAREVESILGHASRPSSEPILAEVAGDDEDVESVRVLPPEERNPLDERPTSWSAVDLAPYVDGEIKMPEAGILLRSDGVGLIYPGRVNLLYGKSESGKTWIAFQAALAIMAEGERVLYVDCEDEPSTAVDRLKALGLGRDDLLSGLSYVRPEGPLTAMLTNKWGEAVDSPTARENQRAFSALVAEVEPSLVIVDGTTALYGYHGLDVNDAASADRTNAWLKGLTDNGRATVIVIDHVTKGAERGALPFGSQHKMAMVQGVALQVWAHDRVVRGTLAKGELIVGKDRPGAVRPHATSEDPQVVVDWEMDARTDGSMEIRLNVPVQHGAVLGHTEATSRAVAGLADARKQIVRALQSQPDGMFRTQLVAALSARRSDVEQALRLLVDGQYVSERQRGKSIRFVLTTAPTDLDD